MLRFLCVWCVSAVKNSSAFLFSCLRVSVVKFRSERNSRIEPPVRYNARRSLWLCIVLWQLENLLIPVGMALPVRRFGRANFARRPSQLQSLASGAVSVFRRSDNSAQMKVNSSDCARLNRCAARDFSDSARKQPRKIGEFCTKNRFFPPAAQNSGRLLGKSR
jgi:hypothetical protein